MPQNSSAKRKAVFASASIILGLAAFKKVNEVSGPAFEPILEVCTDTTIAPEEFAAKTGYHEYDPVVGLKVFNILVCLITQFLLELRNTYPEGALTWCGLMIVGLPFGVVSTLESGRFGAKGLLRYPVLIGLLYQLFGISVMAPLVWIPACIYGAGHGGFSTFRTRLALPLNAPGVIITIIVFTVDTASRLWTTCAGILGGPGLPMLGLIFWAESLTPSDGAAITYKARIDSAKRAAFALRSTVPLALVGWYILLYISYCKYGLDIASLWKGIWTEANGSVAFMTVDGIVLFLAVIIYIAYRDEKAYLKALGLTSFLGPGAACSLVLADIEMNEAVATFSPRVEIKNEEAAHGQTSTQPSLTTKSRVKKGRSPFRKK